MSIFSDYKCGALSEDEFRDECNRMNRIDRIEQEEMYLDIIEDEDEDE